MKYWIVCLLFVAFLSSCKEKHEEVIDTYVKEHFYDPSSYECISLGEPVKHGQEIRVYHQYRAKGVHGMTLCEDEWVLDEEMTKIVAVEHKQMLPGNTGIMLYPKKVESKPRGDSLSLKKQELKSQLESSECNSSLLL